ncbi:4Fe-4S ferredoxin [Candidatus Omnitrophus magneticus]|uniref:4Fe-4S ferredoxin n=1 Tax=Candidatus Omnitrophus magneticus TaxID=1609969 RepID=A0A0F0CS77_9BACT|nr:4Fe-4S ferredoxin [Candidatus Omnitrophus magneticus]
MALNVKSTTKLVINIENCKGCLLCLEVCPAKVFQLSEHVNKKGVKYIEAVSPEKCVTCGRCFAICPDTAIEINPN